MMLGARTAAWSSKRLPYDEELDWIGTPYYASGAPQYSIDTGFVIGERNDIVITCDALMPRPVAWSSLFISYTSETAQSTRITCYNGSTNIYCGYRMAANRQMHVNFNISRRGVYRLRYLHIEKDGSNNNLTEPNGDASNATMCIFSRSNGKYSYSAERMVYSFKIESTGGEVYFDGIPVLKDGVAYMYDRVTGKLFGNALDGVFTFGSDKVSARGGGVLNA